MKKYTDKDLADYLLEMRQKNGRELTWNYFRKHARELIFFCVVMAVLLALGVFLKSWGLCMFVLGLVFGMFSRDRAHSQQIRSVWPFYGRVFDWLKIEKMAAGESSD